MGIRENVRRYVDGLERDPKPFFGIARENVPEDTLMGPNAIFGIVYENIPLDMLSGPVLSHFQVQIGNAQRYVDGFERDPKLFFGILRRHGALEYDYRTRMQEISQQCYIYNFLISCEFL